MNICLFTRSTSAHESSGGMETQTQILAEGLIKRGHHLTLITTAHPAGKEFENVRGIKTHYLKDTPRGVYSKNFFVESSRKFLKLHKRKSFDVVLSVSDGSYGYAVRLKAKLKVPLVIILHGTLLGELKTKLKSGCSLKDLLFFVFRVVPFGIYTYFFRDLPHLKKADFIVAVSKTVERAARKEYFIKREKIGVIYNGVDIDKFNPEPRRVQGKSSKLKKALGIGVEEKVILYLGRLEREKGVHLLLKALPNVMAGFKRVRLLIVGEGKEKENLVKLANKLGLADVVSFLGPISYEDTPKYYSGADIFVFPSLRYEGFPMTVVESMACGTPVIASKMGGIPEAIEDGVTGLLTDPGSKGSLTKAILILLENERLISEMSKSGRDTVEKKFSQEIMVNGLLKIVKNLKPRNLPGPYIDCYKLEII